MQDIKKKIEEDRLTQFFQECDVIVEKIVDDWYYFTLKDYMGGLRNTSISEVKKGLHNLPEALNFEYYKGLFLDLFEQCMFDIRQSKIDSIIEPCKNLPNQDTL